MVGVMWNPLRSLFVWRLDRHFAPGLTVVADQLRPNPTAASWFALKLTTCMITPRASVVRRRLMRGVALMRRDSAHAISEQQAGALRLGLPFGQGMFVLFLLAFYRHAYKSPFLPVAFAVATLALLIAGAQKLLSNLL